MAQSRISVLVADDNRAFRGLVRTLLDDEPDLDVVAEAADGEEAIAEATEHAPNVVLMDIRMPKLSGIDAARALYEIHPSSKVLMLTASDESADLFEAIKAGASGYLLKDAGTDDIGDAVRQIHGGQAVLSSAMAAKLLPTFASSIRPDDPKWLRPLLTNPEMKVLNELADGRSAEQIALRMGASEATVNNHVHNLLVKLHLHLRIQAAVDAIRNAES